MDKLDLPVLFIAYLLRLTQLFLLLYARISTRLYDYWFNTCDAKFLMSDLLRWFVFVLSTAFYLMLHAFHLLLKLIVALVQRMPFWSFLSFWPRLYYKIFTDPKRRSIFEMMTDPRYLSTTYKLRARVSRQTKRQFLFKGKRKITPTRLRDGVNSGYESHGAYAHLGSSANESDKLVKTSCKTVFFDDPLRLSTPYQYFVDIAGEPPDNAFRRLLALIGISLIFIGILIQATMRIHMHAVTASQLDKSASQASLATVDPQEGTDNSFSFDSDGLPFVIDNSATCIICNDRAQFVGHLRAEKSSIETTNGSASAEFVGTISLTLTSDNGEELQYHIPGAIYDPNSPFNILGIPFLGHFLGRNDSPSPTSDDDGTYVQSSAKKSRLVWDHGKYERHFTHDARSLPILHLNTGSRYYQAFCSRVSRAYDDIVHYAFSSSHSIIPSDVETPLRSRKGASQVVTPDSDFVLGQDVLYTDDVGNQERVVYEGATPDGQWHTLRKKDTSKIVTPSSNVKFLEQPDFGNLPSTPLDYIAARFPSGYPRRKPNSLPTQEL